MTHATTDDAREAAQTLWARRDLRPLPGTDAIRYWALRPQGQDSDSERARFAFRREWRLCGMRAAGKSADHSDAIRAHYADLDDALAAIERGTVPAVPPTSRGIW